MFTLHLLMGTAISNSIQVTAACRYEEAHSDPLAGRFLFSYRITITNHGASTVQLLRRHWTIHDSLAAFREVEGPGVVGETPVIAPGRSYSYSSACDLRSGMGRMEGTYLMVTRPGGAHFKVRVPTIHLRFPHSAN
jgi:ApaG protein